jgi:23S rRNA pseudouridine2457 synthase
MAGVDLGDFVTRPCGVRRMGAPPDVWQRHPPVRYRALIPTSWLEIVLHEGKNRQIRRMTASVGFPTLRLIRRAVGDWALDGLLPGQWREIAVPRQPAAKRRVNSADSPGNWLLSDTLSKHKRKESP